MALVFKIFSIYPAMNLFEYQKTSDSYICGFWVLLPTSSQDLTSNRAPYPPIMDKILQNQAENHKKL
jgi:hypothetical protein